MTIVTVSLFLAGSLFFRIDFSEEHALDKPQTSRFGCSLVTQVLLLIETLGRVLSHGAPERAMLSGLNCTDTDSCERGAMTRSTAMPELDSVTCWQ